jgi:glycosyltransferase 2 family protein
MTGRWGWVRRLATVALIGAAVVFIGRTVITNSRDLATFQWRVRFVILALSVVAHVGVLAWGVFVWSRVLRYFVSSDVSFVALLRIWAFSSAARYIPGGVWQFFAAARMASSSGLSRVVTLSSMLVHVVLSLIAACVIAVATLPLSELGVSREMAWFLRVAVPIGAVACTHPAWINLGLRLVPRALHKEVLSWRAGWVDALGLLCLQLLSWMMYGAAYFLFLLALAPLPFSALPSAAGVNALSFVAGWVAIAAPGGLGVKEWAMTLLLSPLLPAGVAAVVAVAARLWLVVAEIALAAVALLLRDRRTPT